LKKGLAGKPEWQIQPEKQQSLQIIYERDPLIKARILQNANGICELCGQKGPFIDKSGHFYLEGHHVVFLSQGGEDTIANAVVLSPNCPRNVIMRRTRKLFEKKYETR
jgi:5-methylcytosine-specific restriction protein A